MDKKEEMAYIVAFAVEAFLDSEIDCNQLRALWTAYCLHHHLDVDTMEYDRDLKGVERGFRCRRRYRILERLRGLWKFHG